MTQPIQEQNEQRQISGLDYRTRQLARRPCNSCGELTEPSDVYHKIANAGLNEDTIKDAPGVVTGYYVTNPSLEFKYAKLYDLDDDPDVGTDIPTLTLGIPPLTAANIGLDNVLEFYVGIAIAMTAGIADDDTTAMVGNDLGVDIFWQ